MTAIADVEAITARIWRSSFDTDLTSGLEAALREQALVGVRAVLERALIEELDAALGFAPYARQADGPKPAEQQRSGYFHREVVTVHGRLADMRVPKLRRGNAQRQWQILTRYQTTLPGVLDRALYAYTMGLSLRDVQELLYVFVGHILSRTAVNRITLAVHETMTTWRSQPVAATPPVLLVDGVWVQILYPTGQTWTDASGHVRQEVRGAERVILTGLAVWPDGQHSILHYEVAAAETQVTWTAFLEHLVARGVDPSQVRLVVSDGTTGLLEALRQVLPQTASQRCTEHKARGLKDHMTYQHLPSVNPVTAQPWAKSEARQQRLADVLHEARDVFQAPTEAEARQRLAAFQTKWTPVEPQAVHNFTWGIQRCFTFYPFPADLHGLIRSTNLLERFFREFRTKADEIGAFPNEGSCLTLFYLVMVREHTKHDRADFAKTERH
jgi:transposase-like protein